jgi:hypothetical protein
MAMNKIIFFCLLSFSFLISNAQREAQKNGTNVAGKMYFSDKPFTASNAGSKISFRSSEFIYGRIEIPDQTLKEIFKLPNDGETTMKNKNDTYLRYSTTVIKDGVELAYWGNDVNYIFVTAKDKNSSSLNFDILPSPAR